MREGGAARDVGREGGRRSYSQREGIEKAELTVTVV